LAAPLETVTIEGATNINSKQQKQKSKMLRTKENTVVSGAVPPYFSDEVHFRILDAEFKNSSAGNPMIVWELEIVGPDNVVVDGKSYDLTTCKLGFGGKVYLTMKSEKEDNWGLLMNSIHPKLGLPEQVDDENPDVEQYKGLVFSAVCTSQEKRVQRRVEKGKYEVVMDPVTNKPKTLGWELQFDWKNNIIGLSSVDSGVPH